MTAALQNLGDSIGTLFVGMGFVLAVLFFIYLVCALVGGFFVRAEKARQAATEETAPEAKKPAAEDEKAVVVAIAAALDQVLQGQQYRVVSIKAPKNLVWVEQGRADIFRSKKTL